MKKISAVALLLVSLSMPAFAGPRDDDSPGRLNPVRRVVHFVQHLLAIVFDDPSWPKP
jgi:hypothetical protein